MDKQKQIKKLSHADIVRAAQQRQLDFDLDGDGLTVGNELKYGLNPYCADTDGDNVPDAKEIAIKTKPGRKERQEATPAKSPKQLSRDRYFECACSVLGWSSHSLSYDTLYEDIAGNDWVGRALDKQVFEEAVQSGQTPTEAAYLLAQSPYLQFEKDRGAISNQEMFDYANQMLAEHDSNYQLTDITDRQISEESEGEEDELSI